MTGQTERECSRSVRLQGAAGEHIEQMRCRPIPGPERTEAESRRSEHDRTGGDQLVESRRTNCRVSAGRERGERRRVQLPMQQEGEPRVGFE